MSVAHPVIFISYCWSSFEHESWVLDLAESLLRDGVDVKLDKWDLKEGHDLNVFMESMVHDSEITKVIMVFDHDYVRRADDKKGGVGTETQIISNEVYGAVSQDKFVGVVREKDDDGNAYVPIYYRGKKYIDLSDDSLYHEQYEILLRWIYEKPLYQKPEIGKKPDFLDDAAPVKLSSSLCSSFRAATDAIKKNKTNNLSLVKDYVDVLVAELSNYSIEFDGEDFLDDKVVEKIDEMRLLRNQVLDFFSHVARFQAGNEVVNQVHSFFEKSIPYSMPGRSTGQHRDGQFDNYKYFLYELFLYFSAMMIKEERFSDLDDFLKKEYYADCLVFYGDIDSPIADFSFFYRDMKSFEQRNHRLSLNRTSLVADFIRDGVEESFVHHRDLAQADTALYIRSMVRRAKTAVYCFWFPLSLVFYADSQRCAFEAFLKARNTSYFERFKKILLVGSKEELMDERKYPGLFENLRIGFGMFGSINVARASGLKDWATVDD